MKTKIYYALVKDEELLVSYSGGRCHLYDNLADAEKARQPGEAILRVLLSPAKRLTARGWKAGAA